MTQPSAPVDKKHLSVSQLDMLSRCGLQWEYRYVQGLIMPPGFGLIKGKAVHGAAAANFTQKLETHEDLPAKQIQELAVAAFEAECAGGYEVDEDSGKSATAQVGDAKDEAAALGAAHARMQAPDYQPALVEARFRLELPGPVDLVGVIDLASDQKAVVDFKNVSKSYSQSEADTTLQLTAYAAGHIVLTGEPASDLKLDVLVSKKAGIDRQELSTTRGEAHFGALAARVNAANKVIQSGAFMPAQPSGFSSPCSWCGYRRICPAVVPTKPKKE